jgi:acylpyruvate hydrolase
MKLVRFSTHGQSPHGQSPRLGALQGDRIADLQASLAASLARRGVVRAQEIAAALVPQSTRGFLEGGAAAQEAVASITEWVTVPASSARLHAPIVDPGKFICIGLNYRDHAAEGGNPIPKEPPIFAKWANSILDPGEPILRPRGSQQLDWEVELGVVIGRTARYVAKEQAFEYVWGYTIINDVSARDFQFIGSQWMPGKIPETFAPLGPYIADTSEIRDPHVLDLKLWVNGEQMQSGNTRTFIFDVPYLVSYLSGLMTLSPGDLIATGTPPGVGFVRKPPVFLQPGDTCRLEITGLGQIENPVKEA